MIGAQLVRFAPLALAIAGVACSTGSIALIHARVKSSREGQQLEDATMKMLEKASEPDASGLFVIHLPAAGCPPGWTDVPAIFVREGKRSPGCMKIVSADGRVDVGLLNVDYLLPQETVELGLAIPIEQPREDGRA